MSDPRETDREQDTSRSSLCSLISEVTYHHFHFVGYLDQSGYGCGRGLLRRRNFQEVGITEAILEAGYHTLLSYLWIKEVTREIRGYCLLTYITSISPVFHLSFNHVFFGHMEILLIIKFVNISLYSF